MSELSKLKGSPPRNKVVSAPRRTKWWAYVLLILALALAWPAIQYNISYRRMAGAHDDMAQGNLDEAIRKLEIEARIRPQSGEVAYWLAVAHRRAGRLKKFTELISQAKDLGYSPEEIDRQTFLSLVQTGAMDQGIEQRADKLIEQVDNYSAGPLDLYVDEFYEARARGFLANFRLIDAEVALNHWIEARPESILARMLRAEAKERQQNRFQAAESEYRQILKMDPRHFEARFQYARLLLFNQRATEAAAEFETCLESAPNDPRVQLGLAECEFREGKKIAAARSRLEDLLTQNQQPDDRAKALFLLGEIARFQGKPELVIKYLTEATELSSSLGAAPYQSLSSAFASLRKRDLAEKYLAIGKRKMDQQARLGHLSVAIVHDPTNGDLRYEQGALFEEEKNQDQAAIWWNMAVRFDPDHLPAHASLEAYYSKRQDQERVEFHHAMAAQAAPKMVERLWKELTKEELAKVRKGLPWLAKYPDLKDDVEVLTLGLAIAEGKDLRTAEERLKQLAVNSRLRSQALTLLGEAHRRQGNYWAARQMYERILAANAQDAAAHWGLEKVCADIGSDAEVESHAQKVVELDSRDYRPHRTLGEWHLRHKRWNPAMEELRESLRLKPDQPDKDNVLLALVESLTGAQKYTDALTTLKDIKASPRKAYLEARCRYEAKEIVKAKQLLDTATRPPAEYLPSLLLRANIAVSDHELEIADRMLSRALKLGPLSSEPHRKMAGLLRQKGELDAARAEDKSADDLEALEAQVAALLAKASQNPEDAGPRKELAVVSKRLGRDAEAKHWEAVAQGMSKKMDLPALEVKSSVATTGSQRVIVAPVEKPRSAGPLITPSVNEPTKSAPAGPSKPCGEVPLESEKVR
jgi:tetratricopeptide (TPR) repeat protein